MSCLYELARIKISRRCNGYYLRWYYNGWHYWLFATGRIIFHTEGEKYRTLGTQKLIVGSTQLTEEQTEAIRTITNTREIYIYTDSGWGVVRVESSSWEVFNNITHGYDIEITIVIGSRAISSSGFSPAIILPEVPPSYDFCEGAPIGTQVWMCLNYDSNYPGSKVYNNDEDNRSLYGGLYTFNQVKTPGFCPIGWHVPTHEEWQTLIDFVGTILNAGGILKTVGFDYWSFPNTGAVDTWGFDMRSTGMWHYLYGFLQIGQTAYLWCSDEAGAVSADVAIFQYNSAAIILTTELKSCYCGLRLIKDTPSYEGAPTGLTATEFSENQINLAWTLNTTDEDSVRVERKTGGGAYAEIANLPAGTAAYNDNIGLNPCTLYTYRVRVFKGTSCTVYSNVASAPTSMLMTLTATGTGAGVATLRLSAIGGDVLMTINGNGKFYDDAAGTLNEGTTRTVTGGAGAMTFYLKNTAGVCTIVLSNAYYRIFEWGGSAFIGWESVLNAPTLYVPTSQFPYSLYSVRITGLNTISGNIGLMPAAITFILITGQNTISGTVLQIPRYCQYTQIGGSNTMSGDVADYPVTIINQALFYISGNNTIDTYTAGRTWNYFNYLRIDPVVPGGLSSTEVDNLLIDLAPATWMGSKTLWIAGINAAHTVASDPAIAILVGKGVTVTVN